MCEESVKFSERSLEDAIDLVSVCMPGGGALEWLDLYDIHCSVWDYYHGNP